MDGKTCSEDGCERTDIAAKKTGQCQTHYSRVYLAEIRRKAPVCCKEGCDLLATRRNMCPVHFKEWAGEPPPWLTEPYEQWRAWRFSRKFLEFEESVAAIVCWDAMLDACLQGVPADVAARELAKVKPIEKEKTHPWDQGALMR